MKLNICGLIFLLLFAIAGSSLAQELTPVNGSDIQMHFAHYTDYQSNENGDWSARTKDSEYMLAMIENGSIGNALSSGLCVLDPVVHGNHRFGYVEVTLNIILFRSANLGARYVSILWDEYRTDLQMTPEKNAIGRFPCEIYTMPLDAIGMNMLRSIAEKGCEVTFHADTQSLRTSIESSPNQNAKSQIESESLATIRTLLTELDNMSYDRYSLWDLNAMYWTDTGANIAHVPLSKTPYRTDLPAIRPEDQLIDMKNREAVAELQKLLSNKHFYAGKIDGQAGTHTTRAICSAQKYYSLQVNGFPDRCLIERLAEIEDIAAEVQQSEIVTVDGNVENGRSGVKYLYSDFFALQIDRCWLAKELPFCASNLSQMTESAQSMICPEHSHNQWFVVDGEFTNLSTQAVMLPMFLQADLVVDGGYRFPCSIRIESKSCVISGVKVLPLETVKIIAYTEIPTHQQVNKETKGVLMFRCADTDIEIGFPTRMYLSAAN